MDNMSWLMGTFELDTHKEINVEMKQEHIHMQCYEDKCRSEVSLLYVVAFVFRVSWQP